VKVHASALKQGVSSEDTEHMSDDPAWAAMQHLHQCLRWARDEVLPKLDGLDEYEVRRP